MKMGSAFAIGLPLAAAIAEAGVPVFAVKGETIYVLAHGSRYDARGRVIQGPSTNARRNKRRNRRPRPRSLRDPAGCLLGHEVDGGGKEAKHTLLPEAALEGAHRIWVGLRLLCPLGGGAIGEQHERPNDRVAPLRLIDKAQL